MLSPEVPSAMPASATRAFIGRLESTRNIKGDSVAERPKDASENSFKRRNAVVSGPWYTKGSSVARCLVAFAAEDCKFWSD